MRRSTILVLVLAAAGAAALLGGCATLGDLAGGIRKPEARVIQTEIEDLSFESVSLRFDVEVTNPNPVGIELAGFDYQLSIEGNPFASGTVDRRVGLAARGRSVIPVPVELAFQEVYDAVTAVAGKDEFTYDLVTGFSFDLPVLGRVRVPVSTTGSLPVIRAPRVRLRALRAPRLSLSGATIVVELEVENRNGFGLALEGLQYSFAGNGQPWASGSAEESLTLQPRGRGTAELSFQISFAALGRSVYQLLLGGGALRYDLQAALDLRTTLPALPRATLPLNLEGEVRVSR